MSRSLYIHVPFCRTKCAYCDFYSVPLTEELAQRYVIALRRELQMRARGKLDTIYIGGGTPSILQDDTVPTILECLQEHTELQEGAEITVESNPESLTASLLKEFDHAGVNRLSLGVQSFNDNALKKLGRPHNAEKAMEAIALISNYPKINLSLDLMYALPSQNMQDWQDTLKQAISFDPSHISAYELTPEPDTVLWDLMKTDKVQMPDEQEILSMFHETRRMLCDAGFIHYEISNYARPNQMSRHNMNYWRRGEHIGLGPGSVSFTDGVRRRNLPDVAAYCDALLAGVTPPFEEETPTQHEAAREFLMLGLRTMDGVSITEAEQVYGIRLKGKIADKEEFLKTDKDRLSLTESGLPVMNSVLVRLFEMLEI